MKIRLDRALVSNNFMNLFVDAKLVNMKISTSDHNSALLESFTRSQSVKIKRFRFENSWLRDLMCGKIFEESLQLNQGKSTEKIGFTLEILEKWGKEITGSFRSRVQYFKRIMPFKKGMKDAYSIKLHQDSAKSLMKIYSEQEVLCDLSTVQTALVTGGGL